MSESDEMVEDPGLSGGRVVQLRTVRQLALNLLGQGGHGPVMKRGEN